MNRTRRQGTVSRQLAEPREEESPTMMKVQLCEVQDQRLILAHADSSFAARATRCLSRLGYEVYCVKSGASARRLAHELTAPVVVLDADLAYESGWLLCQKLTCEQPELQVVLVSDRRTSDRTRFARFVGASGLVFRPDGVAALAHEILRLAPTACR
jgi:DNA-binding response OmpR family regulator